MYLKSDGQMKKKCPQCLHHADADATNATNADVTNIIDVKLMMLMLRIMQMLLMLTLKLKSLFETSVLFLAFH